MYYTGCVALVLFEVLSNLALLARSSNRTSRRLLSIPTRTSPVGANLSFPATHTMSNPTRLQDIWYIHTRHDSNQPPTATFTATQDDWTMTPSPKGLSVRLRPVVREGIERRFERIIVVPGAHRSSRSLVVPSGEVIGLPRTVQQQVDETAT